MTELIQIAGKIVAAFVSHNSLPSAELPALLGSVYARLGSMDQALSEAKPAAPEPATSIKRSIRPDHLICLHCGKKHISLKRHLGSTHNQTPDEYRATFSLPATYPMVAPDYSEKRSALAKASQLGVKRPPEPLPKPQAPRKRGRPRKAA